MQAFMNCLFARPSLSTDYSNRMLLRAQAKRTHTHARARAHTHTERDRPAKALEVNFQILLKEQQ